MSLNSRINKELYKGLNSTKNRKARVITYVSKEQKEEVIHLFMKGGDNTTPIIAEKLGYELINKATSANSNGQIFQDLCDNVENISKNDFVKDLSSYNNDGEFTFNNKNN